VQVLYRLGLAEHLKAGREGGMASSGAGGSEVCSDEKVANRESRVWHFVIENGY
jgi:hypothetical protein